MCGSTRRLFLGSVVAGGLGAFAGCVGGGAGDVVTGGTDGSVEASFFVAADFASNVAGDAASVETLVPFGQHGHGWEPGPEVQRRVFDADVFVYVGEGFQPWADRLVRNLRGDEAETHVVEAWHGVDLLDAPGGHDGHEEGSHEDEHHDEDGTHDEHDQDGTHDEDGSDHEAADDDHAHGGEDPHFWLDPTRAARSVETIANGFTDADSANESTYAENASAYAERLATLDETFASRLEGRTTDAVLVAGHNSVQYLGERYGFHVEALTGISPDAEPTPKDVQRAQSIVAEHDVEYVLAPVFESDRAANLLVEETDATDVLPITALPGVTGEWHERNWGYVQVMEEVNLPTLERALGAT